MSFRVRSMKVGEVDVPGPEVFWMSAFDEWLPLWFQVVLIEGDGVVALVNTGLPADLDVLREAWGRRPGDRHGPRRDPGEKIEAVLAAAGLRPTDVTHVFVTPLQLYTTDNLPLFDRATICLSKRGWIHFHTTHDHPHDSRWTSIRREILVHLVTDAWSRVRLLEDEDEVAPGLSTWWSGAHHRASFVIEVDTADGRVAISDSFFYIANVEGGRPLGISESLEEAIACAARVRSTARHVVPLYDPGVFERYPCGLVAGFK